MVYTSNEPLKSLNRKANERSKKEYETELSLYPKNMLLAVNNYWRYLGEKKSKSLSDVFARKHLKAIGILCIMFGFLLFLYSLIAKVDVEVL
jgi:hypothetical protein